MRMVLAMLVVVAACARAPVAAPVPPAPSEAMIRDQSHAVLDAFDRGDVAALRATLASSYVHFEGEKPSTRDAELELVAKRKPDAPHIASRAWQKEYVFVHPDSAVFIGRATEKAAGNAPAMDHSRAASSRSGSGMASRSSATRSSRACRTGR